MKTDLTDLCPKCKQPNAMIHRDEVDIGVGVQEHVYGATCENCGELVLCDECGAWDFEEHLPWCTQDYEEIRG